MATDFGWDSFFSGLVLSSFWAGYALTQILGGKLADKFGGQISRQNLYKRRGSKLLYSEHDELRLSF